MAYLGDGRYDLLEMLKASKNPQINYEGLYEEPADTSINLDPMYNIGARQFGDMRMGMPQATGIMQQAPTQNFEFLSSAYEDENEDDQQVDYLPGQPKSFRDSATLQEYFQNRNPLKGIGGLLGLITGNPILGLIGKGIGALANRAGPALNDFKSASTGAQFFQNLRDRRARNDAAARGAAKANMADARAITNRINTGPTERGPNQNTGGGGGTFGTSSNNNSSFSDYS